MDNKLHVDVSSDLNLGTATIGQDSMIIEIFNRVEGEMLPLMNIRVNYNEDNKPSIDIDYYQDSINIITNVQEANEYIESPCEHCLGEIGGHPFLINIPDCRDCPHMEQKETMLQELEDELNPY